MKPKPSTKPAKLRAALEHLQQGLSRLAGYKKPYLSVLIASDPPFIRARIVAVINPKTVVNFGSFAKETPEELRRAVGDYLTFRLQVSAMKDASVLELIEKARKQAPTRKDYAI